MKSNTNKTIFITSLVSLLLVTTSSSRAEEDDTIAVVTGGALGVEAARCAKSCGIGGDRGASLFRAAFLVGMTKDFASEKDANVAVATMIAKNLGSDGDDTGRFVVSSAIFRGFWAGHETRTYCKTRKIAIPDSKSFSQYFGMEWAGKQTVLSDEMIRKIFRTVGFPEPDVLFNQ